jgi:hypothetical protein
MHQWIGIRQVFADFLWDGALNNLYALRQMGECSQIFEYLTSSKVQPT